VAAWIWFGLFVLAMVLLVSMAVRFNRLSDERDLLEHRIFAARNQLFPLLDNELYRSIKIWRKKNNARMLTLGGTLLEAERVLRVFYWLKPNQEEERELSKLLGKLGAKFDADITIQRKNFSS